MMLFTAGYVHLLGVNRWRGGGEWVDSVVSVDSEVSMCEE